LIIAKEVSVWSESYDLNHIYILNDSMSKVFGYVRNRDLSLTVFKHPRDLNTKYRKFEVLEKINDEENSIEVVGSSGKIYYITSDKGKLSCSCTGFKYHGFCKHIKGLNNNE
jgi:hypothetical protein